MRSRPLERVAIVNPLSAGGICHYTFALSAALTDLGCDVSLITSRAPYELEALERKFRLVPLFLHGYDTSSPALQRKLQDRLGSLYWQRRMGYQVGDFLRQSCTQIVHQQWPINPPLEPEIWRAMRSKTKHQVPLIYTAHEVFPHDELGARASAADSRAIYRELYRHPDRMIVHGEAQRRQAIAEAEAPPERVRVARHGNYHFLADWVGMPPPDEARRSLGLRSGDCVILFFGYIRAYKGLDVLLLAFERLIRRPGLRDVVLLIAGYQPQSWDESFYGGLARGLKIERAVHVSAGYQQVADVGRYFAAAQVVCLPYRTGSQSGVAQLAYAFSRPVVASSVGSIAEAVADGQTGLLVPPEDPDRLADALEMLLQDSVAGERMGRYAREWSGERFSWHSIAEQTLQIYAESRSAGREASCRSGRS